MSMNLIGRISTIMVSKNKGKPPEYEVRSRPRGPLKTVAYFASLILTGAGLFGGLGISAAEYLVTQEDVFVGKRDDEVTIVDTLKWEVRKLMSRIMSSNNSIRDALIEIDENPGPYYRNYFYCLASGCGLYVLSRPKGRYRGTR